MKTIDKSYIGGQWVMPTDPGETIDLINPASEEVSGRLIRAGVGDAEHAILAARAAFPKFACTTVDERIAMLQSIATEYDRRADEMSEAITLDMGAPIEFSKTVQTAFGSAMLHNAVAALKEIAFEQQRNRTLILREPIGVAALITPWNWPMLQTCGKIASALAAGCSMVYKPAELSTHSAVLMAEIINDAGLPEGVFNMVLGKGSSIGNVLSNHPEVDYVSFTGSGLVGAIVGANAAKTAKKIALELGGKSPFIILPDADVESVVLPAVQAVMANSGQTCGAGSRTLVHSSMKDVFVDTMATVVQKMPVGDPHGPAALGPVVSQHQWDSIQTYIKSGIDEGATLVLGGPGKPEGLERGYYVQPTIFADVQNTMTIAREEIFGPVAAVVSYETVDEAIAIANDSPFGLAGYVFGSDHTEAQRVARQIDSGMVMVNTIEADLSAPWGGYKTSGIGREWGPWGIEEYLEIKSLPNYFAS